MDEILIFNEQVKFSPKQTLEAISLAIKYKNRIFDTDKVRLPCP